MKIISVPTSYENLNTLAAISVSSSFVITNYSSALITLIVSSTQPNDSDRGVPVYPSETYYIEESDTAVWIKGSGGKVVIQETSEIISPFSITDLPKDVWTSDKESFRRLRVDSAQTSFFEGREFRTFKEWSTATTATYVIKAVVPINIVLFDLVISIDSGDIRVQTLVGGTEGGSFSETLPVIPANTMSSRPTPFYTSQVVLTAGGTHTDGTLLDVLRVKTASNSNFSSSVGARPSDERGIGANTYYFRITLNDVIGTFKARWEERLT